MANVLHRTTKQFLTSVNTPDYPLVDWIHEPDLSAVIGFSSIYWTITGDNITLMSQAERDAVDAALLTASRDAVAAQLQQTEDVLRAFMLAMIDELNLHALKHNALLSAIKAIINAIDTGANLTAVKANIAAVKPSVDAIPNYPQRIDAQLRTAVRNKLGT